MPDTDETFTIVPPFAPIARAAGARYVLVGHSERRHLFGETDEETGKKTAAAVRAGLTPLVCVGETLAQRDAGETGSVVLRQLRAALAHIDPHQISSSLVAYEPVWAIGTGKTASLTDASTVHAVIRSALRALTGEREEAVPILYGGGMRVSGSSGNGSGRSRRRLGYIRRVGLGLDSSHFWAPMRSLRSSVSCSNRRSTTATGRSAATA